MEFTPTDFWFAVVMLTLLLLGIVPFFAKKEEKSNGDQGALKEKEE